MVTTTKEILHNVISYLLISQVQSVNHYCGNADGPSSLCIGYINVSLSYEDKVNLLERINYRRSMAARGRLRLFPPATNMLKMRWVEELALTAQQWADQCRFAEGKAEEKDTCLDLYSISMGQCIATLVGEAPGLRAESLADSWYMQSLHYHGNITDYTPSKAKSQSYNDFAQMLWSETTFVGCGRSRFMANLGGRLRTIERLICNFAPRGPPTGGAIWTPGLATGNCPPKTFRDSDFLCAYSDNDEVNWEKIRKNVIIEPKEAISTERPVYATEYNKIDDYLSEPVQDLEEVVRRLEKALTNTVPTVGKVRRELRKLPVTPSLPQNFDSQSSQFQVKDTLQNDNITDRGPVMKMVMKYMPVLRQYQDSFSGSPTLYDVFRMNFVIVFSLLIIQF